MNHHNHHGLFAAMLFALLPGSGAIPLALFAFVLIGWLGIVIPAVLAILLCMLAHLNHDPAPHAHRRI